MSKTSAKKLKQERGQLNLKHSRCSELFFIHENARLIDNYFKKSFEESKSGSFLSENGSPYAIVAVGGYGRAEQCVSSDVDVMILFDEKIPQKTEELIREIIYPLWDIALDVGHATRTIMNASN